MKKAEMTILAAGAESKPEAVRMLKSLGYERIVEVGDGVSAWNYLKKRDAELVIADWQLGQFDGLILLKLMLADKKLSNVPVILMCGNVNREMVLDAGQTGVGAILIEPFDAQTIETKIMGLYDVHDKEKDEQADQIMESGKVLAEEGKYEEAAQEYSKILEVYENPEVYYNLGYIKASQKKYDESILNFRKAINIDQRYAKAYEALGEVYLKTGQTAKAEELMQRAGEIYMQKSMSKEAESAFNEVLKLNPNTTNIYNSLGILHRRNGDFDKSFQAYEKALRVDSQDENIFFNFARACYDGKEFKRAKLYFKRAYELCPELEQAKIMSLKAEKQIKEQGGK
ncbi:MAG: tetratricopeptide repeat protein [Deltaproteobacteria bacterium]|nr:tetratricopeptide repeat protein [Deltaproteobacteria bacterium]